jgi:hypothetical protein
VLCSARLFEAYVSTKADSIPDADAGHNDNVRFLHDFQQRSYWESAKVLTSFAAVYLGITSAVLGYVLVQNLKPPLPRLFAATALIFSLLFFAVFSIWAHGLLRQISLLEDTSRRLDSSLYDEIELHRLFTYWRRVNWSVMIATYVASAVLVAGMLIVLIRSH